VTTLICYVNGQFAPITQASVSVQDLAILRGYGVFDFLRTYHGRPFMLRQHLLRLEHSAQAVGLDLPETVETIEQIVHETLKQNNLPEANIRIVVTGGVSADGITPPKKPGLIVLVTPEYRYPDHYYRQGVKVITTRIERYLPHAKTINYIPAIVALKAARQAGAIEALYVDNNNHILEGTTTNIFLFQGNRLITPKDNILPGITRNILLELAQDSFEIVERPLTFADLPRTDEAFITASNKEIMPVHHIDDHPIGAKTPGPKTSQLAEIFHDFTWRNR